MAPVVRAMDAHTIVLITAPDNLEDTEGMTLEQRFQLAGWLIFLACSGLFITQSVIAGDLLGLAAGIAFLLGCLVFLVPFVVGRRTGR